MSTDLTIEFLKETTLRSKEKIEKKKQEELKTFCETWLKTNQKNLELDLIQQAENGRAYLDYYFRDNSFSKEEREALVPYLKNIYKDILIRCANNYKYLHFNWNFNW